MKKIDMNLAHEMAKAFEGDYAACLALAMIILHRGVEMSAEKLEGKTDIKMDEIYFEDDRQPNKEIGMQGGFNLQLINDDGNQKRKKIEILVMKDGRFQVKITPTCSTGSVKKISRTGKSVDFAGAEIEVFDLIKEVALEYLSRYDSKYKLAGYSYSCGGKFEI